MKEHYKQIRIKQFPFGLLNRMFHEYYDSKTDSYIVKSGMIKKAKELIKRANDERKI